jgi:sec-independent protein translocase protein TatC
MMEVKKRLFFILSVFAIGTAGGFIYSNQIIKFMVGALSLNGINIIFTSPFQFINLSISTGVITGLLAAFPLIIVQLMSFLKPALRIKEFKMTVKFLPFSIILFIIGFTFGALIMKWQIQIFLSQSVSLGIGNMLDVTHLLSVVLITSALMGLAFQTPIILLILMRLGVLKHSQLSKARPWVYIGSFVFAVLLPPDSIIADVLLTLPLVILFEITLILNKFMERTKLGREVLEGV